MKKTISVILAGGMLLSACPTAAQSDVKITINNEEFVPKNALGEEVYPFIENGTTYLPVRAMGEAVGKEVGFDGENNAVYVGVKPAAKDAERNPIVKIDDRIFFEEDEKFYGSINTMEMTVKMQKIAKTLYSESEIENYIKNVYAFLEATEGELLKSDEYLFNEYVKYVAYVDMIGATIKMPEEEYEKYVTARHILVSDKETAEKVLEKLKEGADFADLTEEYNTDPGQSRDSAYTFTYNEMVKEFEEAAFALKEGEYTKEAVKTQFGYHIIERLPLDRESVPTTNYQISEMEKMLGEVSVEKVRIKSGDYGKIEGFTVSEEALEIIGGGSDYGKIFEFVKNMAAIKKCMDEENILAEHEKESADNKTEEYKGIFPSSVDDEKAEYFASLMANYVIYMTRMYAGTLDEGFDEKFGAVQIDAEVFEFDEIKVFVDGKLIVPTDVNGDYVSPKNVDGTVYVPVRAIVQALGMKADWDNDTRSVLITK